MSTQNKDKQKEKDLLATDYSIPRFSFKQAVLLMLVLFLSFSFGIILLENISAILIIPTLILISILTGSSIVFIQFYKQKKSKKTKWVVSGLFSILTFIILFSFYFANTIF